jgi:uncharacterized membrane protein required for colicin V production
MTASQWLDLAILAVAFVAAISGWRSGVLGSLLSFIGVVLGAVAGVLLAPHVVTHIDGNRTRLFVALFLVLGLVVIGEIAGVVLGRAARAAIRNSGLRTIDSLGGVALQVVTILLAAWVLAIPFTSSDQPNLAAAVRGSRILTGVDKVAPEWVTRELRASLSKFVDTTGLPDVFPTFGRTPIVNVEVPDPGLASDPVVAATRPSVLKIRGVAPSCQRILEGSGFVVSPNRVMSNAHVVAGSKPRARPTTRASCPTTPMLTSPFSTCRICRRRRWASTAERPRRGPTRSCWVIPAAGTSPRRLLGFGRSSSSVGLTFITPPRWSVRCIPSEALSGKVIRADR